MYNQNVTVHNHREKVWGFGSDPQEAFKPAAS